MFEALTAAILREQRQHGTVGGALLAVAAQGRGIAGRVGAPRIAEPMAGLLVIAWLGYRLHPYVPAIDLQVWKDNLKPLLLDAVAPEPLRSLRLAVIWTAASVLTEAALGRRAASWIVPLGLAGALAAEVVIPGKRLTVEEVIGAGLALPAWLLLRHAGGRRTAALLAGLLLAAIAVERLEPFTFLPEARDFGWVPFLSLIAGSWEAGMQAILQKLFLYGALLWCLWRAGLSLPVATGAGALAVFGLSLAQTHLPGRSAEITDTAMLLGLGIVFHLVPPRPRGAVTRASVNRCAGFVSAPPTAVQRRVDE